MTLRPYQRALVGGLHRAVKEGADAVLMQSPTGSGKTSTIAEGVILPSLAQGRRFVFAAHLEELLDDTAARLRSMGVALCVHDRWTPLLRITIADCARDS